MNAKITPSMVFLLVVYVCGCADRAEEVVKAASSGDLASIQSLLERDPRLVNVERYNRMTPLAHAAMMGHKDVVEYLLRRGARLEVRRKRWQKFCASMAQRNR
jgi:ankyrin repeat protein